MSSFDSVSTTPVTPPGAPLRPQSPWDTASMKNCAEKVAIVTTEAATNLLKHAGRGRLLLGSSFVWASALSISSPSIKGPG